MHGCFGGSILYHSQFHAGEPSTHVLTPLKIGALREVARDNIFQVGDLLVRVYDNDNDLRRHIS